MTGNVGNDPVFDKLMQKILGRIASYFDERSAKWLTSDGRLRLGKTTTTGTVPAERGGWRDHAHDGTDAQQLVEANTHQSLDTDPTTRKHWTREDIQDMIAVFLVDGSGAPFTYDDSGNVLTIRTSDETFGIVFTGAGDVALRGDGSIATKVL